MTGDNERPERQVGQESAFHEGPPTASGAATIWMLVHFLAATHPRISLDKLVELIGEASPTIQEVPGTFLDEMKRRRKRKAKPVRRIEGSLESARKAREQLLLDHLQAHFESIPRDTRARIAAVDDTQLIELQLRILTEPTLESALQDLPPAPPAKNKPSPAPPPRPPPRRPRRRPSRP